MNIKPCLFVKGLNSETVKELQALKSLGYPILLLASDLQKTRDVEDLMDHVSGDRIHILSNDVDEQKHELQEVWEACAQRGWTHLFVVEELNHEIVSKVPEVMQACLENPWDLIVLNKKKESAGVEKNIVKKALLGSYNYNHLMTSLCCYPVLFIQTIKLKKNTPFAHLKILCRMMWKKIGVTEINIEEEIKDKPKSLIEKFYLASYETILTSIANIRENTKPKNAAISCAVGAFIACTPFYGLQTFGIFIACFIFRLNFPIAFLGSQVSLPPIYSLILPLELYVGFKVLDKPFIQDGDLLQMAQDHFSSWMLGAVIVGGVISIVLGLTWYFLQKMTQQEKKVNWTGKMRGGKLGNLFLVFVLKNLGQRAGYFLLYFIIPYFYLFAPKARRGLSEYWQVRLPKDSFFKRQFKVMKQMHMFAKVLMDRVIQGNSAELCYDIDISQSINFTEAAKSKQPLLVLLSHFGGWGMVLQGFGKKAYTDPISIIEYENENHSTEEAIQNQQMERVKRVTVKPGEPLFMHIHQLLGNGGNLGLMGDRPFDESFELLPFMGKLAPIPTTPLRLAKIYKCEFAIVLGVKTGFKSYKLIAKTFDSQGSVEELTQEYLNFLETHSKDWPYQWFNFYNFWSSMPTLPNGTVCFPKKYNLIKE